MNKVQTNQVHLSKYQIMDNKTHLKHLKDKAKTKEYKKKYHLLAANQIKCHKN
jgi:hypothetical protein